jgi:hypothetical protein
MRLLRLLLLVFGGLGRRRIGSFNLDISAAAQFILFILIQLKEGKGD